MPNVPMCQKMPIFLRTSDKSPEVPQSTQNPKSCPANLKPKTLQLHNHIYCVPWKYSWFLRSHFPLEDFLIAVPKNFHQNWRKYRKVANLHDIEEVSIVLGSGVEPLLDALQELDGILTFHPTNSSKRQRHLETLERLQVHTGVGVCGLGFPDWPFAQAAYYAAVAQRCHSPLPCPANGKPTPNSLYGKVEHYQEKTSKDAAILEAAKRNGF